jgi:carboxymethylenebutenolidase
MIEHDLVIQTSDGAMNTFVTHPEEGGPFPVVLFYMDAPGKREELHDMARRIATAGYYVMLPNLYYRKTPEFVMARGEEGYKRMFALMEHLTIDLVMRDTQAMLDFVDGRKEAKAGALGAVGYCMSGPFVFAAAGRFPERVRCAASIYGVRLATDAADSPHLLADKVQGELYFACAETDKYAPKEMVNRLEVHLKQVPGLRQRVEWYPGVEHGFAFPLRQGVFHKPSAERHWERLFALFRRNLG